MKIQTVYRGDVIRVIKEMMIPRNLFSVFKSPPIGETEASWRHGYNAACSEIEIAVRDLRKYTVDAKDQKDERHDDG